MAETWGNNAAHSMAYNRRLQAAEVKLKQTLNGSELQRYNYSYGVVDPSNGNVDTSKNNGQIGRIDGFINGASSKEWDQRFSYDELGRLANAAEFNQGNNNNKTWQMKYTYDRWANRYQSNNGSENFGVSFTPVASGTSGDIDPATNRFKSSTGIIYDGTSNNAPAGNVTSDPKFRGLTYGYDANNRQTSAANGSAWTETQVYDGVGQRVRTSVATSAATTYRAMVYDIFGNNVADYSDSAGNTLQRENFYRGGLLASRSASGAISYVLQDIQGSTRAIVDNNSTNSIVTSRHDYRPFGEEIFSSTGLRTTSQKYAATNPWANDGVRQRFAMTARDDASGLDHTWWRKNESVAGRWTSVDPLNGSMMASDPQTFNRYSYVQNDPVNLIDPSGLKCGWVRHVFTVTDGVNPPGITVDYLWECHNDPFIIALYGGLDSWPPNQGRGIFDWNPPKPRFLRPNPITTPRNLDDTFKRTQQRNLQDDLRPVQKGKPEPKGIWRGVVRAVGGVLNVLKVGANSTFDMVGPIIWTPEIECAVLKKPCGPIS